MLVLGDINAHHGFCHCNFEDSAGKILASVLENENFVVLNENNSTFLTTLMQDKSKGANIIDLSIASSQLAVLL